jgi:hypothetical protein
LTGYEIPFSRTAKLKNSVKKERKKSNGTTNWFLVLSSIG